MSNLFNKAIAKTLPFVPKPMVGWVAKRYVAGETLHQAIDVVKALNARGARATLDYLGEFITTEAEAHETAIAYKEVFRGIKKFGLHANVSVKLSAVGLLLNPDLCLAIMDDLCFYAQEYGNFIRIDMEDSQCTQATIDVYLALREKYDNVGLVLQAYLKRTPDDMTHILANKPNAGHFRLCKGIYIEPPDIAYQGHDEVNRHYLATLEQMFQADAFVGIATHDVELINGAKALITQYGRTPAQYEFQMLLGVTEQLGQALVDDGHPLRIYVPYGHHWYGYSLRRLKENPKIAGYVFKSMLTLDKT
jgi:proline dehydrogenase